MVKRGTVASGATGAGEGNILVSDKEPGPELELARLSRRLWRELGEGGRIDYRPGHAVFHVGCPRDGGVAVTLAAVGTKR